MSFSPDINNSELINQKAPDPLAPMPAEFPDQPGAWLEYAHGMASHARRVQPRVVFLGDSITNGWLGYGLGDWRSRFMPLPAANLGIGGDRTQNVLWRIADGSLDGISPELVVLLIGVNNLWSEVHDWSTQRVSEGVAAIVSAIRQKCPETKVLVLGVLPTGHDAADPLRVLVSGVNAHTAATVPTDDGKVEYLDIGGKFVMSDNSISEAIMPDGCHLSSEGYRIFAEAIEPSIRRLLA